MYAHFKERCLPCEEEAADVGVGQASVSVEVVNGIQQLKQASADALLAKMGSLFPVLTSSGYFNGTMAPAADPNADFWTYIAYPKENLPAGTPGDTVNAAQFLANSPESPVIVDIDNALAVTAGQPVGLNFLIGRTNAVKQVYAAPSSAQALLTPRETAGGGTVPAGGGKKTDTGPLIAAAVGGGLGFLVAGPVGAVVGAGTGFLLTSTKKKA